MKKTSSRKPLSPRALFVYSIDPLFLLKMFREEYGPFQRSEEIVSIVVQKQFHDQASAPVNNEEGLSQNERRDCSSFVPWETQFRLFPSERWIFVMALLSRIMRDPQAALRSFPRRVLCALFVKSFLSPPATLPLTGGFSFILSHPFSQESLAHESRQL
jgi:hypothetical protein